MSSDRRRQLCVVCLLLISLAALVVSSLIAAPVSAQEPEFAQYRTTTTISTGFGGGLLMTLAFVYGCVFVVGVVRVIRSQSPADALQFWPLRCMVFLSYGMILASLVMVGTLGQGIFLPLFMEGRPNPADFGAAGSAAMAAVRLTGLVLLSCLAGEGVLRLALVLRRWLAQLSTGSARTVQAQPADGPGAAGDSEGRDE